MKIGDRMNALSLLWHEKGSFVACKVLLFSIYFQAANEALITPFPDLTSLVFNTEKGHSKLLGSMLAYEMMLKLENQKSSGCIPINHKIINIASA